MVKSEFKNMPVDLKDGLKFMRLYLIGRNENPKLRSKRPTRPGAGKLWPVCYSQPAVAFVKLGTRLFIYYLGVLSYYKGRVE